MPRAAYTLELMLSYGQWTDITADWQTADPLTIERGIEPGERVAGVGRMTFTLHSAGGRYVPGHSGARAGFDTGIFARLSASDGLTSRALFTGRVESIRASRMVGRQHAVEVSCVDDMTALFRVPVGAFPMLFDVTPGDLVRRLLARSVPGLGQVNTWRLDHPQAGQLGVWSTLSGPSTGLDLDTGQSVFPWAGDSWAAGLPLAAALDEVCASEGGWFFVSADGTPTFRERHARPKHTAADGLLDAGLAGVSARYAQAHVANQIDVTVHPRAAGTAEEVLWQAGHSIRLRPGERRTLVCRYHDPDEQVAEIGALSVILPVSGTDFTATTQVDGTGENVTSTIHIEMAAGGAAAELTLWSDWSGTLPVYIHGLVLRGVALRRYVPVTVSVIDAPSLLAQGSHPLTLDMPLQEDSGVGEDMARALLASRVESHGWPVVEVEATASAGLLAQAITRDVGDRLHITADDLGLDGAPCFVEHIRHRIERGGASHRVTWQTTPADLQTVWVLGTSQSAALGTASRLGY